jgi:hypothetical protein
MGDAAGGTPAGGEAPDRRGWRPPDDAADAGIPASQVSDARRQNEAAPSAWSLPPRHDASMMHTTMPGSVAGLARAVTATRVQGGNGTETTVVTFRLEQHDPRAGRTSVMTVRLLGDDALGFVSEGDWVEVLGKAKRGFIEATKAVNHTSQAQYSRPTQALAKAVGCVFLGVFGLVFVGTVVLIIMSIVTQGFS